MGAHTEGNISFKALTEPSANAEVLMLRTKDVSLCKLAVRSLRLKSLVVLRKAGGCLEPYDCSVPWQGPYIAKILASNHSIHSHSLMAGLYSIH